MTTPLDLFTRPFTMPDGTERRALVRRLPNLEKKCERFIIYIGSTPTIVKKEDVEVVEALLIRAAHEWAVKKGGAKEALAEYGRWGLVPDLVYACHLIADARRGGTMTDPDLDRAAAEAALERGNK